MMLDRASAVVCARMKAPRRRGAVAVVLTALALPAALAVAAEPVPASSPPAASPVDDSSWDQALEPGSWCGTFERYIAKGYGDGSSDAFGGCPLDGQCDDAPVRDGFIPNGFTPMSTYSIHIHVFCASNGTNCAATQSTVDWQMNSLNSAYDPSRIDFTYETSFHNNSTFRFWSSGEENAMKSAYADAPNEKLNVYVVSVSGGYSFGTFPWDSDATGNGGGIVMDQGHFSVGQDVLAHEAGHCLGLWHTHHGVSEVNQCSSCYERAGTSDDNAGDRCSDTDPTPVSYSCGGQGGSDPCNGVPWGATDPQNYMSYGGPGCWNEFTPQQAGRVHCWTDDVLSGWLFDPLSIATPQPEDSLGAICSSDAHCANTATCVGGICYVPKNRYVSIAPNPSNGGRLSARRVLLDLGGGTTALLGWLGEPVATTVAGEVEPKLVAPIVNFFSRHLRDWNVDDQGVPFADATVHLGDCHISPGQTYIIQAIIREANVGDEASYSDPLVLTTTSFYGDVVGESVGTPPDGNRNFNDIASVVRGFQNIQTEPKVWLELQGGTATPELPDLTDIGFSDINAAVAGFQGGTYPHAAPCDCPGAVCP